MRPLYLTLKFQRVLLIYFLFFTKYNCVCKLGFVLTILIVFVQTLLKKIMTFSSKILLKSYVQPAGQFEQGARGTIRPVLWRLLMGSNRVTILIDLCDARLVAQSEFRLEVSWVTFWGIV